jgi:cell wall-associated NlpC family hydrolase
MPAEAAQRAAIVREARSWIGTPYHNCADVKGRNGGVDCGMLLVRVFVDAGLVAPFDPRPYPPDWHLHRAEEKYLGFVFDRTREVFLPSPVTGRVGKRSEAGVGSASAMEQASHPTPDPSPSRGGEIQPGDVAVFRFGRCYSHGGVVTVAAPLTIVHAYAPARCVVEEPIGQNPELADTRRAPRFFSYWAEK